MSIIVKGEMTRPASTNKTCEVRYPYYLEPTGLKRRETRGIISECDTSDYSEYRDSPDNGRTWGAWVREKSATKQRIGEDEYEESLRGRVWNPVHGHFVCMEYQRLYLGGYKAASARYWRGESGMIDHGFLRIETASGESSERQLVAYEDGVMEFHEETYRTPAYYARNLGIGEGLCVLKNGDILFTHVVPMDVCCRLAGVDSNEIFASVPKSGAGVIVVRGKWNAAAGKYNLTFSDPIMVDDRQSSRGVMEPMVAELASGKILMVFRISNVRETKWNSRISPYAPSYKMYCLSDDGKTFSPPMPWHFDSREVVYSSSTRPCLLRSEGNGRLYWVGNYTDPTKSVGNFPRYPLHIAEVDEEWGVLKKASLTEIDTRREGESEEVQLSNFDILQDRETGNLELYLVKIGQYPNRSVWEGEGWKYTITLPE